ncbi:MAG: lipoprotein signal peptidase [Bacteroidales bacterium]|nr:lipoprotein signal peptidase [Bacteroidales bacterium]
MNPLLKKSALIIAIVVILDQILKIWVKTHMYLGESSVLWGWPFSRFQLAFTENPGMAFGWMLPGNGGKIALTVFRILAIGGMSYYIWRLTKNEQTKPMFVICMSLITAGALGNLIDCLFYGMIFGPSGVSSTSIAEIFPATGGYAPFLQGKVVDMLYFPIIESEWPTWMPILGDRADRSFTFFSPIFNIADSAVTIGVFLILLFHKRILPQDISETEDADQTAEADNSKTQLQ